MIGTFLSKLLCWFFNLYDFHAFVLFEVNNLICILTNFLCIDIRHVNSESLFNVTYNLLFIWPWNAYLNEKLFDRVNDSYNVSLFKLFDQTYLAYNKEFNRIMTRFMIDIFENFRLFLKAPLEKNSIIALNYNSYTTII